jgi:hypothetical protein
MVNFLHYGVKRHVAVKPTVKKAVAEKKEEEMTAQVVMAESTAPVMQEENITIAETDTVQEVVKKVRKSKKLHAKVSEDGSEVRVKQVLKD